MKIFVSPDKWQSLSMYWCQNPDSSRDRGQKRNKRITNYEVPLLGVGTALLSGGATQPLQRAIWQYSQQPQSCSLTATPVGKIIIHILQMRKLRLKAPNHQAILPLIRT